jgi:CheY-like chemotaxis protein
MSSQESTLIVDDNVDACRLLGALIGQLGERATCWHRGVDALEYLRDHIPRLILLEAEMPGMSGMEVLKAIRTDPRLAAVPVIMMSRQWDHEDLAEIAKQQGATEFWIKSEILYQNLKQLIARYLTHVSVNPRSDGKPYEVYSGESKKDMN